MKLTQEQIEMLSKASRGELRTKFEEPPQAVLDLIDTGLIDRYAVACCGYCGSTVNFKSLSFSLTDEGKAALAEAVGGAK